MNRVAWISLMLALLVAATFFYDFDNDAEKNLQLPASGNVAMREDASAELEPAVADINDTSAVRTESRAADAIAGWARVANSEDQNERSAAIDALASAPKAQALPLLQKLIGSGTAEDREAALNALRAIARNQGDADNEIQNILRLTIYDGDESVATSAQLALDDVESYGGRPALTTPR